MFYKSCRVVIKPCVVCMVVIMHLHLVSASSNLSPPPVTEFHSDTPKASSIICHEIPLLDEIDEGILPPFPELFEEDIFDDDDIYGAGPSSPDQRPTTPDPVESIEVIRALHPQFFIIPSLHWLIESDRLMNQKVMDMAHKSRMSTALVAEKYEVRVLMWQSLLHFQTLIEESAATTFSKDGNSQISRDIWQSLNLFNIKIKKCKHFGFRGSEERLEKILTYLLDRENCITITGACANDGNYIMAIKIERFPTSDSEILKSLSAPYCDLKARVIRVIFPMYGHVLEDSEVRSYFLQLMTPTSLVSARAICTGCLTCEDLGTVD